MTCILVVLVTVPTYVYSYECVMRTNTASIISNIMFKAVLATLPNTKAGYAWHCFLCFSVTLVLKGGGGGGGWIPTLCRFIIRGNT